MGNRTCVCCGKEYSFCPNCNEGKGKPDWMKLYCGDNCKTIFDAGNKYSFGRMSKEEASEIIKACDLSNLDNFKESSKKVIREIIKVSKPSRTRKAEPTDVIEEPVEVIKETVEIIEEPTEL